MRRLNKCFILCLGVLSCLLFNFFTTQKAEARTFSSGYLVCNDSSYVQLQLTGNTDYQLNCGRNSGIMSYNGSSNVFGLTRMIIQFNPMGSGTSGWPQDIDEDAYGMLNFSINYEQGADSNPPLWIGDGITVLEQNWEIIPPQKWNPNTTGEPCTTISGQTENCRGFYNGDGTIIMYSLKIKIPKQTGWNGQIKLMSTWTNYLKSKPHYYFIGVSQIRLGWYMPSAAELEQQKELEDRSNLESQSGETDSNANNSEQQFQSGTTNLIGAVTSFTNAMRNARTGSCKLPEISAYGVSLGQLDLCTYSPPSWVQGLTSTILSLITVGMAWHVFKRIMGIAKGMAGKG